VEKERQTHAWSGTARQLLDTPKSMIEEALDAHLKSLLNRHAAGTQVDAWSEEIEVLRTSFRDLAIARPDALRWGIVLEYELPLEGGRRPDVILTVPNKVIILEFKQDLRINRAYLDQTYAYARDISEYHSKSHELEVVPILVPTKSQQLVDEQDGVRIVSPDRLAAILTEIDDADPINFEDWLKGDYAPLPTLIQAARMIFQNERLPSIKRAESLGVGEAVTELQKIAKMSEQNNEKSLAFVSGVPGAGKTLVGLRYVYESSSNTANSIFLSGNKPLVEVLRDALKAKAFVRDLHSFIKSYGVTEKVPSQRIIVFDEAQRAWDAEHMGVKNNVHFSEPELLIRIGEKIDNWANLVGLIGHGQEINSGEEAGIEGWNAALESDSAISKWKIYVPSRFSKSFPNKDVTVVERLDLNKSLRSRRAEDLHEWVSQVLEGHLSSASVIAQKIFHSGFKINLTRNLDEAREFIRLLYSDEPGKRYGILASSKDTCLPTYGIMNGFQDTQRIKYARWYNNPAGEEGSSNNLQDVVTEFGCQGLEVDCALVAWGNDLLWDGNNWQMRKLRPKFKQHDPLGLRKNSYRVLLTRSRDEMVIFVPPEERFDSTEMALLAAGARVLQFELQAAI
jgi:Uncharacterized conserved protein (DUF2075)